MTITFVPGEVNKSSYCLLQLTWKNHHIIVYGSGNNLIITSSTTPTSDSQRASTTKYLQTIYLEKDPKAIDINPANGYIAISLDDKIVLFKPINEYMTKPQWNQTLEFSVKDNSKINCLQWAALEEELIVGTNTSLILYHVYNEYGTSKYTCRWVSPQLNPVTTVDISDNANRIVTTSGHYDRLAKLWSRINYGDENTLFELSYLNHPKSTYITQLRLRINSNETQLLASLDTKPPEPLSPKKRSVTEGSMANIKNIRGYIDLNDDHSDILYTITNDHLLRVWATYEFSGHSHIKSWATFDLSKCFIPGEEIAVSYIVDNYYLQRFIQYTLKTGSGIFKGKNPKDIDLLCVVSTTGKALFFTISNISVCPPNNIHFEPFNDKQIYEFTDNTFPLLVLNNRNRYLVDSQELTQQYLLSEEYLLHIRKPISIPKIIYRSNITSSMKVSLLFHDRIKNTVRYTSFDFMSLLKEHTDEIQPLKGRLINKFQGQTKSIRKLIKSNSSTKDENVLLSILNFPQFNYIWESLVLDESKARSITKRYRIDVSHSESPAEGQGIWNAVILNDIEPQVTTKRRHIVITLDKDGFISLWDCDGHSVDDLPAKLMKRLHVVSKEGNVIFDEPMAFLLTKFPGNDDLVQEYCVVSIFENDSVHSWKLSIEHDQANVKSVDFVKYEIENLLQNEKIHRIAGLDTYISALNKNLVSTIDVEGCLRIFALDFDTSKLKWRETYSISTNVQRCHKIHGATNINRFAVVDEAGSTVSIWDIKTGVLEYEETFPESYGEVRDLDWTFINSSKRLTSNAIFSVGFSRFVLLYTQLRYDYTNKIPTFAVLKKIDISDHTSHEIGDLIWLNQGNLVIGSGNQFFIDSKWVTLGSGNDSSIDSTIRQLMIGYSNETSTGSGEDDGAGYRTQKTEELIYDIENLVRILNGPLPVYHPQFLIQCLFMNQVALVQDILVSLFQKIRRGDSIKWDLDMDISQEIMNTQSSNIPKRSGSSTPQVDFEHDSFGASSGLEVFKKFNSALADLLLEKLMKISLPLLTRHQQITLISVVSIVKDMKSFLTSFDINALRFFIGFKLFQQSTKQSKLSMRDINWALHSDNKEMILSLVEESYKGRMKWDDIKKTGLVYWVKTPRLIKLMEAAARNEFAEQRDPSGRISLFYLALRKKQILLGLWKTVSHPEQQKMLKFLKNDFSDNRWRSAALKNAYVLLGKHRYIDAASFFLLADSVKDCCNILANKVDDILLAIGISKVYEGSSVDHSNSLNKSLLSVIESFVLPQAIASGDRWTTSWIFWQFNLKEASIQALIKTPLEIVNEQMDQFSEQCQQNYLKEVTLSAKGQSFLKDDPVLILLFDDLRQKKINYLKGSLHISPLEEMNFINKVCMIYTRMGCDYLAVLLIRNWKFIKLDLWNQEKMVQKNIFGEANGGFTGDTNDSNGNSKGISKGTPKGIPNGNAKDPLANKAPPPPSVFEEPDMSSFDFGF